jgi:hypothetical protein
MLVTRKLSFLAMIAARQRALDDSEQVHYYLDTVNRYVDLHRYVLYGNMSIPWTDLRDILLHSHIQVIARDEETDGKCFSF